MFVKFYIDYDIRIEGLKSKVLNFEPSFRPLKTRLNNGNVSMIYALLQTSWILQRHIHIFFIISAATNSAIS